MLMKIVKMSIHIVKMSLQIEAKESQNCPLQAQAGDGIRTRDVLLGNYIGRLSFFQG